MWGEKVNGTSSGHYKTYVNGKTRDSLLKGLNVTVQLFTHLSIVESLCLLHFQTNDLIIFFDLLPLFWREWREGEEARALLHESQEKWKRR